MKHWFFVLGIMSGICGHADAQILQENRAVPMLKTPVSIQHLTNTRICRALPVGVNNTEHGTAQSPVANNFATQHLPFFCRQELKAEKISGLPLRIRLGSVDASDWLEQKPNSVRPK